MRTLVVIALVALLGAVNQTTVARGGIEEHACCARCGSHAACVQKVCQIVCDVKKEVKVVWSVECREICPLMPGGHHPCDECAPLPRCGHPQTVQKLVRKERVVEIPVYRCVVTYLCPVCTGEASPAPIGVAGKPIEAAPQPPSPPAPPLPPRP